MKQGKVKSIILGIILGMIILTGNSWSADKIKVITTFSDYATIVKEIGGDRVSVEYLSHGDQDPHFVPPKPSLAVKLRRADLFVCTGLDLEVWATTLIDKARNKKIMDGAIGYVTVYEGIDLFQKPKTALSRTEGDIHIYGNPHIHTSPLNWKAISRNILIGLKKVDAEHSDFYEKRQKEFEDKVDRAMFGDKLVDLFGGESLSSMLLNGTLFEFLEREYQDQKLLDLLGGFLKKALPFRNKEMLAYHKNWAYFARDFGLKIIGYIESKPGIPPTPKHIEETIRLIGERGVDLMLVATYFGRDQFPHKQ
jgi:ABC-type Zn uptake system ZnuABC Zn-binding protein ZnuA